jgi:hypothetical protein
MRHYQKPLAILLLVGIFALPTTSYAQTVKCQTSSRLGLVPIVKTGQGRRYSERIDFNHRAREEAKSLVSCFIKNDEFVAIDATMPDGDMVPATVLSGDQKGCTGDIEQSALYSCK